MKKNILYIFLVLFQFISTESNGQDSSDTRLYYYNLLGPIKLNIDLTSYKKGEIRGEANLKVLRTNIKFKTLEFDLLKLKVDSILLFGKKISFQYNDTLIKIDTVNFNKFPFNLTLGFDIFYHGLPYLDPTGFGGVSIDSSSEWYSYNMGVGLKTNPPGLGRAWFPCMENFSVKNTYDLNFKVPKEFKLLSNGLLKKVTKNPDSSSLNYFWQLKTPVPAYLLCFAMGKYQIKQDSIKSVLRKSFYYPLTLATFKSDFKYVDTTFKNLSKIFNGFEQRYGIYAFEKIGYVEVPESGGAMEHATMISYPYSLMQGFPDDHTMGHELSHHWFGNNWTCLTAKDMWINEGWASFNESIVAEILGGRKDYIDYSKAMMNNFIIAGAYFDKGSYPITPIKSEITYGRHVYWKGALVVKALRSYLGDSLFFNTIKTTLDSDNLFYGFGNFSSNSLMKTLQHFLPKYRIKDFFKNWVFQKGMIDVDIEYWKLNSKTLTIKPYLINVGCDTMFRDVNWTVRVWNEKNESRDFIINSIDTVSSIDLSNFNFNQITQVQINPDQDVPVSAINYNAILSTPNTKQNFGFYTNNYGTNPIVTIHKDNSLIPNTYLFEHHISSGFNSNPIRKEFLAHSGRYFKIMRTQLSKDSISFMIDYDGRVINIANGDDGIDNDYFKNIPTEDSVIVLYKANLKDDWKQWFNVKLNTGKPKKDLKGSIEVLNAIDGYYTLGKRLLTNDIQADIKIDDKYIVSPNPSSGMITIDKKGNSILVGNPTASISIYNLLGQLVFQTNTNSFPFQIDLSNILFNGVYQLKIEGFKGCYYQKIELIK